MCKLIVIYGFLSSRLCDHNALMPSPQILYYFILHTFLYPLDWLSSSLAIYFFLLLIFVVYKYYKYFLLALLFYLFFCDWGSQVQAE